MDKHPPFGRLLRFWRNTFSLSQEALSLEVGVSARHISFLETGRSSPGKALVYQLAETFGLSSRDTSNLLAAAGFFPDKVKSDLSAPEQRWLRKSVALSLRDLEPAPAWVSDPCGTVLMVNRGWIQLDQDHPGFRDASYRARRNAIARLALDCVHREYPNKIAHVLHSEEDSQPPSSLYPIFYGCFDWHSSVHGHWLLARLARTFPGTELDRQAREALDRSFIPQSVQGEAAYLEGAGRVSFERPYGLAWLLQLTAELREWDDPRAQWWAFTLGPLERVAVERLTEWLPKLTDPIRVGEHSQTAFAFGLILDWARTAGDDAMAELVTVAQSIRPAARASPTRASGWVTSLLR